MVSLELYAAAIYLCGSIITFRKLVDSSQETGVGNQSLPVNRRQTHKLYKLNELHKLNELYP